MFFVLSKLLLFLVSPAFWIVTLLLWSFLTKKQRRKKVLRIIVLVMFVVFTNPFLFNVCVRAWQPGPVDIRPGQHYSAVILLGGMTMTDRNERTYFGTDADRFIQATKLYHSGIAGKVVLTGGSPYIFRKVRFTEAEQLAGELMAQGIPKENIIVEGGSKNTYENALFTKRLLDSMKLPPPYVVVTSAMHVPRAKAVFRKAGIQVDFFPAAFRQIDHEKGVDDYILPSTFLLSGWSMFLKEIVGMAAYKITGKV